MHPFHSGEMYSLRESDQKSIPAAVRWKLSCSPEQYAQHQWDHRHAANSGGAWVQGQGMVGIAGAREGDVREGGAAEDARREAAADNVVAAAVM